MGPLSVDIVPAQLGFFAIYEDQASKTIEVGEPVVAWRIETYKKDKSDEVFTSTSAITVHRDSLNGVIGVQNPDKSIDVFEEGTFKSLEALIKDRYPTK